MAYKFSSLEILIGCKFQLALAYQTAGLGPLISLDASAVIAAASSSRGNGALSSGDKDEDEGGDQGEDEGGDQDENDDVNGGSGDGGGLDDQGVGDHGVGDESVAGDDEEDEVEKEETPAATIKRLMNEGSHKLLGK